MQKEKIREGVELKGLKPDSQNWNFKMQKEMNLQIKRDIRKHIKWKKRQTELKQFPMSKTQETV